MKKILFAALMVACSLASAGGSSPGLAYGQVPTAGQWNSYFASKLDFNPGPANTIPYWDGSGNLLYAPASGDCTAVASVFTCTTLNGVSPGTMYSQNASAVAITGGTVAVSLYATSANAPTISSSSTIAPTAAIVFVSGTSTISTITPPSPISTHGGTIRLIPTGLWSTTTGGNIALGSTAVVNKALEMTYDAGTARWYPSY